MTDRSPLPPIRFGDLAAALLGRADTLVPAWLPGGTKRGHEYQCGDLSGGAGSSLSVNLTSGQWSDFATGDKGGDLISLYAAIHGLDNGRAAVQVAREEGLETVAGVTQAPAGADAAPRPAPAPRAPAAAAPKVDEGWQTLTPVPSTAPPALFWHFERNNPDKRPPDIIAHTAAYRMGGQLLGYVVRFVTSDGSKETLPYTWCTSARDGASAWRWRQWDTPRPLYVPAGTMPEGRTVVLVEGEKKADTLHALLEAAVPGVYLVASWPGGANAWHKALWDWLQCSAVLLWPDCDAQREKLSKAERDGCADDAAKKALQLTKDLLPAPKQPGMAAMLGIGALLRDAQGCTVQLLPIPEPGAAPSGWDCGDAITTDGWDAARVLAFFAQAYALPAGDGAGDGAQAKKIDGPVSTEGANTPGADSSADDGFEKIGSRNIPVWLVPYYDKNNKRWLASRKMVILILERDPVLAPILAYNELNNNIQSRERWPWPHAQVGDVTDSVDLLLGKYLTDTYGLPSISRAALSEAIETVAHTRRFHPVREYLQGLPVHAGQKSRIDNWLVYVLGESPESLSSRMREYLQIVGRCWLLGMVHRVMTPGCKFDYCPVLEGIGGLRKSTMVEILASGPFYSDTPFEVGKGKEAQEQVQGLWLYEIAELTHFSKAEVGAIKAFVSSKVDRYRVAYGSTVGTFPRQCILVGTTNENTYLRDRTGNRRFWPIPVKHIINTEWLAKYRDALFAEAYALYLEGVPYTPIPAQEARLFVPMQESRLVETALMGELMHILTREGNITGPSALINAVTQFVTLAQLVKALDMDAIKSTAAQESAIRSWLENEGWTRAKVMINGVRAWGYLRPSNWPRTVDAEDMTAPPPPADMPGVVDNETKEQDDDDAPF
jgi:putative DNA primase/helicase